MSFIAAWVSNIIIFVLLATVIDMLLPNSSLQKYTKMVIGLLLIAIILTPLLKLFQTDFEDILTAVTSKIEENKEDKLGNLTELKKKEIQATQSAYILEQMAVQMKNEVEEELIEDYEMAIQSIEVEVADKAEPSLPEDLTKITISLREAKDGSEVVEAIAKVEIDTSQSPVPAEANYDHIKEFLSKNWSVDEELILINGEGGG